MNILFVTWDGPQVSYLESLFVPIFQRLGQKGMHFHVLQFTWGGIPERRAFSRQACEQAGISYRSVIIWAHDRYAIGACYGAGRSPAYQESHSSA